MKISSGIIITDGKNILLGHSTGNSHWDIPKGGVDDGESTMEAAIRETEEEIGLSFKESQLVDLGLYAYLKKKNLYLYKATLSELPKIEDCKCNSFFKCSIDPAIATRTSIICWRVRLPRAPVRRWMR